MNIYSLKICVSAILISFSMYERLDINVKKIIAVKDTWLMQLRKESKESHIVLEESIKVV